MVVRLVKRSDSSKGHRNIARCRCSYRHKSYNAAARCVWRAFGNGTTVIGEGQFAMVSRCEPGNGQTVRLFTSLQKAHMARLGECGASHCRSTHQIDRLTLELSAPVNHNTRKYTWATEI